jgi:hypothetical protein
MANSYRHSPFYGNCSAGSEKFEKALSARRARVLIRSIMANMDEESLLMPTKHDMFDMDYLGAKDGKSRMNLNDSDPEYQAIYRRLMRK